MYGQKIRTIERNKWTARQTQKIIRVQTLESAEQQRTTIKKEENRCQNLVTFVNMNKNKIYFLS